MVRVLLVEDDEDDVLLVRDALAPSEHRFVVEHVDRLEAARRTLASGAFDVVLLDLSVPDARGVDTLVGVLAEDPGVPVVVLTGSRDEDLALRAVRLGAQDYLRKDDLSTPLLVRSLRYAIERHRLTEEVRALALEDPLTRLANRRGFRMFAERELRAARRAGTRLVLLYVDLDGFKAVNDRFGHDEGDRALVRVAEALRDSFREVDVAARLGGDEFAVLAQITGPKEVEPMIDRLRERLRGAATTLPYRLELSVGATELGPDDVRSVDELIGMADRAMYEEKKARGR